MNEREQAVGLPPTPGYRYADAVGDQLFVAGQVPHDADGRLVGAADPIAQAELCLANLAAVLDVHGFAWTDIRHLRIYVVGDRASLVATWRVVVDAFDGEVPPATLLGVAGLGHEGQLVEIDASICRA